MFPFFNACRASFAGSTHSVFHIQIHLMSNHILFSVLKKLPLFILFLFVSLSGCQKEKMNIPTAREAQLARYDTPSGAHLVLSQPEEETAPGGLEERTNDWDHSKQPKFPYYDGKCRLILRLYKFDPNLPHGGFGAPCSGDITIRGYSQPNGLGTLLFTKTQAVIDGWIMFELPQSAYIQFRINQTFADGPCRFKLVTGEYGWNRAIYEWYNIPYNQWLPIIMGRFAPKDPSTYGNEYSEYLCAPWCTWSGDVSYLPSDDPWDNQWTTTRLSCSYGTALPYIYPQDPRVIKDHFIYEKINQTVYFYPLEQLGTHNYYTKAENLTNDPNDLISYMMLGANGQGEGPFGWGVSGAFQLSPGCNLMFAHDH